MKTIEFKDYELKLEVTSFVNIIGKAGSGKTKLLKLLINKVNSDSVYLDERPINTFEIEFLRKNIAAVLKNEDFKTNSVKEELLYYQKKINVVQNVAYSNIDKFVKFFGLENIIDSKIGEITTYEKAYIKILSLLIINPTVLGIDDLLTYLNFNEKFKIIKYARENDISIINVTTNAEELLFGTHIVILDNSHAVAYDKTENILSNNKMLSKIGMNEPFIVEMSTNLNYYDLLKKKYFNMKALVGELWK